MARYFSLSIGGLPSDSDVSIHVESFAEIKEILDAFSKEIPHKFIGYKTQLIMNKPPEKFPHWDKVYMVKAILEDSDEIPMGYCNFKKTFLNSISAYYASLISLLVLSLSMVIRSFFLHDFDILLWSGITSLLSSLMILNRRCYLKMKLLYLMK